MQALVTFVRNNFSKWNSRKFWAGVASIAAIMESQADPTVQVAGIAAVAMTVVMGQAWVDKVEKGMQAAKQELQKEQTK